MVQSCLLSLQCERMQDLGGAGEKETKQLSAPVFSNYFQLL